MSHIEDLLELREEIWTNLSTAPQIEGVFKWLARLASRVCLAVQETNSRLDALEESMSANKAGPQNRQYPLGWGRNWYEDLACLNDQYLEMDTVCRQRDKAMEETSRLEVKLAEANEELAKLRKEFQEEKARSGSFVLAGEYVNDEVKHLRSELREAKGQIEVAYSALQSETRKVESNQKDAERWRFLANPDLYFDLEHSLAGDWIFTFSSGRELAGPSAEVVVDWATDKRLNV